MKVRYGTPEDIASWMDFVNRVKQNFPGLETEAGMQEHRNTVLCFMEKKEAICVKKDNRIFGVMLFSRAHNRICFLAVLPQYRRNGIASRLMETALGELNREKDITVSTFREDGENATAPRTFYKNLGVVEVELTMEFNCPTQIFVLKP